MMLPLRLTLSFCGWEKDINVFLSIFEKLKEIKLFVLELELDRSSFNLFSKNKGLIKLNAFQKVIKCCDFESLKSAEEINFSEIIYEVPFWLTTKELKEHIDVLKRLGKKNIVLSYFLTAGNFEQFKMLLDFAVSSDIKKIVIPNPDLVNEFSKIKDCYLQNKDLKKFDFIKNYLQKISFQVHDFFLAKYLNLKDAELFKGCQAGSLMGYIQNGTVYPCKSIPVSLGSLFEEDFATIWKRGKNVMKRFESAAFCKVCTVKSDCKLGCPGNAFFLNDGNKDPLCGE